MVRIAQTRNGVGYSYNLSMWIWWYLHTTVLTECNTFDISFNKTMLINLDTADTRANIVWDRREDISLVKGWLWRDISSVKGRFRWDIRSEKGWLWWEITSVREVVARH